MKSKGSASLYEVLKSASRPGADPAPAAGPAAEPPAASEEQKTRQERLAEYKARKLAAAQSGTSTAVAVAEPTPIPVAVADPTPPPASIPTVPMAAPMTAKPSTQLLTPLPTPPPMAGPGERVIRLTSNTAAFAALVVVGLAFVACAIGVKIGRARAADSVAEATVEPVKPAAPAQPPQTYSIRLAEWPSRNSQEHVNSVIAADTCKKALERAGFKNAESVKIMRDGQERLALYLDRVKDPHADSAKTRLAAVQKVKVQMQNQIQTPFAQAAFEEVPREPARTDASAPR